VFRRDCGQPDTTSQAQPAATGSPGECPIRQVVPFRVPVVRGRHVQVLPGHPPHRHLLVRGGHRLDHRALLHRLRPPRPRHHLRHVRGGTHLPRPRTAVAHRRTARGHHLPYRTHHHPDAPQARPGRAWQVPVPVQAHDHRGRADRTGGVALVPRHGRQGRGGHRRHLVADRERRLPGQHPARAATDEARQLRTRGARGLPGDLRRERRPSSRWHRKGARAPAPPGQPPSTSG
jgi:hypothetical protein